MGIPRQPRVKKRKQNLLLLVVIINDILIIGTIKVIFITLSFPSLFLPLDLFLPLSLSLPLFLFLLFLPLPYPPSLSLSLFLFMLQVRFARGGIKHKQQHQTVPDEQWQTAVYHSMEV